MAATTGTKIANTAITPTSTPRLPTPNRRTAAMVATIGRPIKLNRAVTQLELDSSVNR